MKQLQEATAYQAEYSRPISNSEIDFPFNQGGGGGGGRPDSSGSMGSSYYIERPVSRGSLPPLEA